MDPGHPPPSAQPVQAVVVIGLKDVYELVVELRTLVQQQGHQQTSATDQLRDHESRLRSVERSRWPLPSAAVVLALASLVVSIFMLVAMLRR